MKKRNSMVMVGLVVLGLIAVASPADVISFQQGGNNALVTDYQGTDDNTLHSGDRADQNAGTYHLGPVGISPWGGHVSRGLLRFDLSAMAGQYVAINSITLKFHPDRAKSGISIYGVKPANADWAEGTK